MYEYFRFHSKLDKFELFSVQHLLTVGIIISLGILIFIKKDVIREQRQRNVLRLFLAFLLLISEVWEQLWLVAEHSWTLKKALPLQLSDLAVILAIVMLVSKNKRLFQFMYFAGLGSSIQAILTPDLDKFSFPHIQYIEFFVSHGGVVLACIWFIVVFNLHPKRQFIWITILIVNLYAVCIFFVNRLLKANYLYLMEKPGNSSILDFLGPWPWYILSLELVMIGSFYILYAPFFLKVRL
ncbi:TIGR02206 family membrane protein [Bacillus sp. BRMEA1]|uniref:YwaF family protein n=1 Tax=Neobacillus endophyticus TaxID=2738405 RepID=UPI0015675EB3|nr:TIGR02206 family membrane protein [Neobacillus endophyticus]NRD78235.1 TIGR02206 family membrane protein [Neobacillus endophyticus]